MAADGLDTGFGSVGESAWRTFVLDCALKMNIKPGERVYEVGCGAGAFLLPLAEQGIRVGGIDYSPALVGHAREYLPAGDWRVGDAAQAVPPCEHAAACGVFLYFPSLDYAARVVRAMTSAATRGVMILDIPDSDRRETTEAARRAHLGEAAYAEKYRGLDHFYYRRDWFGRVLDGFECTVEDQAIAGYGNAAGRFNVFARRRPARPSGKES
jgi:trans-aconitate methyltransferase